MSRRNGPSHEGCCRCCGAIDRGEVVNNDEETGAQRGAAMSSSTTNARPTNESRTRNEIEAGGNPCRQPPDTMADGVHALQHGSDDPMVELGVQTSGGKNYCVTMSTGQVLGVGANPSCEVAVCDDEYLSHDQCQIQFGPSGLSVQDLGSTNGTWVGSLSPTVLGEGDVIVVGLTRITVTRCP